MWRAIRAGGHTSSYPDSNSTFPSFFWSLNITSWRGQGRIGGAECVCVGGQPGQAGSGSALQWALQPTLKPGALHLEGNLSS